MVTISQEGPEMAVEHVPLLKIERDLHDIPRGIERFQAYLKTLVNDDGDDVRYLPLVAMNPMGREHVTSRLDELLAIDGDTRAAQAIVEATSRLGELGFDLKHGLVVVDDVRGGWTNRTSVDFGLRFSIQLPFKRPWVTTIWWVSETPTAQRIREAVLTSIFRLHHVHQQGTPKTLRQMMRQEGAAGFFAGLKPRYDEEELDYTRHVIEPILDTTDYGVQIAALYGNNAASSLGYAPLGLSDNAGLDLALADAFSRPQTP
jgi:hypothetical protein